MSIRLLPEEVASQIAAGEVVERPASVVKELLENALDAGAEHVLIRIEQAGKRLIEVSDDGVGIPVNELQLALARHATSKLSSIEQLFSIVSLGFRGEALASIASVSRMTISSRVSTVDTGARLRVEAGQMGLMEKVSSPVGTLVQVEDLFYCVPARLKFLKSDVTERQQIDGLVTRYAMAYPQVKFELAHDCKKMLQTTGSGDRREVLANLYGVDIARQMLEVILDEEGLSVTGFISPLTLTRSNRKEITFFVNGRWIQDGSLTAALLQAYRTLLMVGRFPLAAMFLHLKPDDVDVNVHPAKAEVRFRKPDQVFSAIQRCVRRGLLAYSPLPQIIPHHLWGQSVTTNNPPSNRTGIDPAWVMAAAQAHLTNPIPQAQPGEKLGSLLSQLPVLAHELPLLRLVGQVGTTYLVAEGPDGLYLIDQHAAHERVLFDRMMKNLPGKVPSQALLQPITFEIPSASKALLENNLDLLDRLGFQVEAFGGETFRIRAVPAIMTGGDPVSSVRVIVEDFEEDESPMQNELEARMAARICKRMAVKGGQVLSTEEQQALLRDLETCQSPRTCPHGRPTMIHLSVDLLERQFGRRGAR